MRLWKWDEGASALTPDGAALHFGVVIGPVLSLAVAPRPDEALQLLAGCYDGTLSVLGRYGRGAGRELQQQAALDGHSGRVHAVAVMMPPTATPVYKAAL